MIGFLVLGYWLTTKTPLGRYIYAIGGNESAARLAGVPIVKAKIFVYAFSGLCAAFVGLIVASQLQTAHPMTGNMFEMDAIGATVLGGTAAGRRPRPGDRVNYRRLRHRLPCRRHGDDGRQRLLADGD